MAKKGIIRRIDDLGRIVIPREYRKLYGIELGDPIEINAYDTGEIILTKVNTQEFLVKTAEKVIATASEEFPGTIAVSDFSEFLTASADGKPAVFGKPIGKWAAKSLKERENYMGPTVSEKEGKLIEDVPFGYFAMLPILENGDCFGGIFLFDNAAVDINIYKALKILAKIIASGTQKY